MKFTFSFQKVLDVKEKEQEMAQQEYGTIKQRQMEVKQQIESLEVEKQKVFDQYNHVDRKSVSEIVELQHEIEHFSLKMKRLSHQSQLIDEEAEQKQQVLIEKSQQAKMWNQWKAKSKEAWQRQLDQKEQAMLDEMAILRYSRRV